MYQITLRIDGMACSMCESHVCDTIRNQFKVKKVSASHAKGEAVICLLYTSPRPRARTSSRLPSSA